MAKLGLQLYTLGDETEQEQFDRPPLESAAISLRNLHRIVREVE